MSTDRSTGVMLPGHRAPGVGFEAPFDMLQACHERVARSLDLLQRLIDHASKAGVDAAVRDACADVLRYFDRAAPLHHEDEERHVFPLLLEGAADFDEVALVHRLQADHVAMAKAWAGLQPALQAWCEGSDLALPPVALQALATPFIALYADHIRAEEELVYPAARALIAPPALVAMGDDMRSRRQA